MPFAGIATRSYLYVEDVAEAFACVLHKGVIGEVYNIGTQKERTVLDVAQDIAKVFKLPQDKIVHVRDRAFNDRCALGLGHAVLTCRQCCSQALTLCLCILTRYAYLVSFTAHSCISTVDKAAMQAILHLRQQAEHFGLAGADHMGAGSQEDY